MKKYDHKRIEGKWHKEWEKKKLYKISDKIRGKKNFYLLVEFPYPSGNLHVGHWYAFSVPDILARTLRMQGKNVLFPIGFDAFGLPAENAAIKNKLNPRKWTYGNIDFMRKQMRSMGTSFDWSREVVTCDPSYYKWTHWQFLQFFKKGLAYRKETAVNWCPSCKTVLANEQVENGHCERCKTEVVQKNMLQWNLKITDYADRLHDDLAPLDWPEPIKDAQRAWIGRSEGAEISFQLSGASFQDESIKVFTTRADTLYGVTYLVLAPEHPLLDQLRASSFELLGNEEEVKHYIESARKKTELERQENKEKTGVELKGVKAVNPATKEEIPVWIADYVLAQYGTGAIMAVPAHDERDFEFATKFDLPIVEVVESLDIRTSEMDTYTGEGILVNSGEFSGVETAEARKSITKKFGAPKKTYKMRDWVVSRQRYWGVPIPIVHCPKCGEVAVPDKDLPVKLPEVKDYLPDGRGKSPLAKAKKWITVKCPKCKGKAERETDTLDTFVDSSWYFLRYTDPKNKSKFADAKKLASWMPVDLYSGGAEHTTMHVLYSRFWQKALFDMRLVKDKEPYTRRMNRSLIMGPDGQKMSKSRGNVVDPDAVVARLGADTVRMYLAFIGPYSEVSSYPWNPDGVVGVRRFLERVWKIGTVTRTNSSSDTVERLLHKTVKKVGEDIAALKFNTAISALMILLNAVEKSGAVNTEQWNVFLKLLSPFAQHIAEELWRGAGNKTSIHTEEWPAFDPALLKEENITIVIQINGKTRGEVQVPFDSDKEVVEDAARAAVILRLTGQKITRTIVVPGRLV